MQRVPLVEQELFTIFGVPEFIPVFSGVRVFLSLAFCIVLCISLLTLSPFSFGHKGNNKITELRTILQRESQNS